jgi:hypothetical protein
MQLAVSAYRPTAQRSHVPTILPGQNLGSAMLVDELGRSRTCGPVIIDWLAGSIGHRDVTHASRLVRVRTMAFAWGLQLFERLPVFPIAGFRRLSQAFAARC